MVTQKMRRKRSSSQKRPRGSQQCARKQEISDSHTEVTATETQLATLPAVEWTEGGSCEMSEVKIARAYGYERQGSAASGPALRRLALPLSAQSSIAKSPSREKARARIGKVTLSRLYLPYPSGSSLVQPQSAQIGRSGAWIENSLLGGMDGPGKRGRGGR